jgi:hypothetical protein
MFEGSLIGLGTSFRDASPEVAEFMAKGEQCRLVRAATLEVDQLPITIEQASIVHLFNVPNPNATATKSDCF